MAIVGNKIDLLDENENEDIPIREEAEDFANSKGAYFFLTSAYTSIGINTIFRELGKIVLNINSESGIINKKLKKKKKKKGGCC